MTIKKYVAKHKKAIGAAGIVTGAVVGHYQFTHAAELHARVILNNLFNPIKKKVSYSNFSWVTFTDPEIAHFGLTKQDLTEQKKTFKVHTINLQEVDRLRTDLYEKGVYELYLSNSGKILGGTLMCRHAGEYIQELLTAKIVGKKINWFMNKIYAYPVASRMHQWAAITYLQKKTTKLQKKSLRMLYKLVN
jgi:pyruvate/2-oxoglutarate dehydrogenase complex dihydrolipoamide dehydrogenase (E3) component